MSYYSSYSKSYHISQRPKRASPKTVVGKTLYALRKKGSEVYWNGKPPPLRQAGWHGKTQPQAKWTPQFTENPSFWVNREDAIKAFNEYEIFRLSSDKKLDDIELAILTAIPSVTSVEELTISEFEKEHDRIFRHFGLTLAQAYSKLKPEQYGDDPCYAYVVKRRGQSKELIDSAELDNVASASVFTFVRTENDALHVKLLLGDNFDRLWSLR